MREGTINKKASYVSVTFKSKEMKSHSKYWNTVICCRKSHIKTLGFWGRTAAHKAWSLLQPRARASSFGEAQHLLCPSPPCQQRHCSLPRGKVSWKLGRMNTTQNDFLYFSALKQANGLQNLSRHPHEESLSEAPTILCWKGDWKGFKLWTAFLFQVLMKPITPKQLRCFLIFFYICWKSWSFSKEEKHMFLQGPAIASVTTGKAVNSCLPKQNCSTSHTSTCTPALLISSNHSPSLNLYFEAVWNIQQFCWKCLFTIICWQFQASTSLLYLFGYLNKACSVYLPS